MPVWNDEYIKERLHSCDLTAEDAANLARWLLEARERGRVIEDRLKRATLDWQEDRLRLEKANASLSHSNIEIDCRREQYAALQEELRVALLQSRDLKDALNRDKTGLATALAGVVEEVKARRWVVDGRGSYAFDDDRYRKETGWALDAIEKIATEALSASGKIAYEAISEKRDEEAPKVCPVCKNERPGIMPPLFRQDVDFACHKCDREDCA